jgi:hypothetical protein
MKYNDMQQFIRDLNRGKLSGVILWRGASSIDGAPIVCVATAFNGSDNEKTGAMVQTFILPDPAAHGIAVTGSRPAQIMAWLKSTGARAICGDCPHAWQWNEEKGEFEKGPCYVREYQAPAAVLGAIARGSYPIAGVDFPESWIQHIAAGRDVRLGAYGDPAACPPEISAQFVSRARTRTGYTHMWKSAYPGARRNAWRMRELVMASCDSMADLHAARDAGFRGFLVTQAGIELGGRSVLSVGAHIAGAMLCPASDEFAAIAGRKTECAKCGACSGAGGKGARMPDVFIPAHGATGGRIVSDACPATARMLERMGA